MCLMLDVSSPECFGVHALATEPGGQDGFAAQRLHAVRPLQNMVYSKNINNKFHTKNYWVAWIYPTNC